MHESRVEDMKMTPMPSDTPGLGSIKISSDVVTQWIKDTLEDASYFRIPGTVMNPEKRNILQLYKIDKETLSVNGIPEDSIRRLYKCMFIYSIGFNELLKSLMDN